MSHHGAEALSEEVLAAIEQRLQMCSPGPWQHRMFGFIETASEPRQIIAVTCQQSGNIFEPLPSVQNADFIAHARQDVSLLISEVRRLQGRVRELSGGAREGNAHSETAFRWQRS
jgi:hypothetical protein